MIYDITFSMLDSSSTFYYDEKYNDVSKSTVLEFRIKHLSKETSLCSRLTWNFVSRGENIRAGIIPNGKCRPKIN